MQDLKSYVFSRWPEHPKANVSIDSISLLRHYWSPISSSFSYEAQSKAIFWYHEPQIYVKMQNSEMMLRCFLIFNRLPSSDMIQKCPVPRNIFLQEKYLYSFDTYCKDLWECTHRTIEPLSVSSYYNHYQWQLTHVRVHYCLYFIRLWLLVYDHWACVNSHCSIS